MEGKQKRGGGIEEERGRRRIKTRKTEPTITPSVAEEATIASTGDNRACSNGGSQEDEYGGVERIRIISRTECGGSS